MAVVITSKFYQAGAWKNISKIVFTSPNIDSPAVAGTRSHILPGEGNLGTWYEDTSQMYRIEDHQWETVTDFLKYHMRCTDDVDLQEQVGWVDVEVDVDSAFETFINEISTTPTGYIDSTGLITSESTKLEYTSVQRNISEIHNNSTNMIQEVIETRSLIDPNPGVTTETRTYYTRSFVATGGFYSVVIPTQSQSFSFFLGANSNVRYMTLSPIIGSIEEWQTPIDTLFNTPIPPGTTNTIGTEAIFIGNFEINGYYGFSIESKYYTITTDTSTIVVDFGTHIDFNRIVITAYHNTDLDTSIFNSAYFGLKNVAFYTELGGNSIPYTTYSATPAEYFQLNATNSIKLIEAASSLTGEVDNPAQSRTYYSFSLSRNYGWYTPVNTDVLLCHLIFEFQDAIRITSMSMSSIKVNQVLWQTPTSTLFNNPMPVGTTTTTNKTYFIGNFTIHGSVDNVVWTLLYTGANTTNLTKSIYFTNTQYYKYYKLSILNNTGLAIPTTGDNTYYGIGSLRFYKYEFSAAAGSINVSVYDVSDPDYPKEFVITNASPIPNETLVEDTITNSHSIIGQVVDTTISGRINYTVNLNDYTDPYDYLTAALCVTAISGSTGTTNSAQTYTKEDKINTVVSATATPTIYNNNNYLLFNSTGSSLVSIDTPDWSGVALITYDTVASGTVISGTHTSYLEGETTRIYQSSLYSKNVTNYRLTVGEYITNSGIISEGTTLYSNGPPPTTFSGSSIGIDLSTRNSIIFELTIGEAYNCRLTAWDDVTHSTTSNELIQGDHVRCSAIAYNCEYGKLDPSNVSMVFPPVHNRIFKGNTIDGDNKYFYGDFDMVYRYESTIYGDFLLFKPMLYGIDSSISYGVHDYIITLHYSYT